MSRRPSSTPRTASRSHAFELSPEPGVFPVAGLVVSVGLCAPYLFRRRYPLLVFLLVCAACLTQAVLGTGLLAGNVLVLFALYNVATRYSVGVALPAVVVAVGCLLVGFAPRLAEFGEARFGVGSTLSFVQLAIAIWLLGTILRVRRAYVESLKERARQLEREKEVQAQIIAAEERAQIAREVHDVVSHSLSVVVMMTEGAIVQVGKDPERAVRTLATVRDTGRDAMAEMRRMVGVLRTSSASSLTPQPGIAQLSALVEASRAAGVPAELTISGEPVDLPGGLGLCVYRIVQEALTNARKHGGAALTFVDVSITFGDHEVVVSTVDDGVGPNMWSSRDGGHGLVGMRERVALYGGEVDTTARVGGGFVLTATLPIGE